MKQVYFPVILSFLIFSFPILAQPTLELNSYATGFTEPVDVTNANDGTNRLFVVEKAGTIKIFDQNTNTTLPNDYLDISGLISSSGERGLLGLAFAPDFATSGYFFVNYTNNSGDVVIARYQQIAGSPNDVDEATAEIFLSFVRPRANHNAGDLEFGPDGYLWIPTGDSGGGNDPDDLAQDSLAFQGKVLRIDVDVPAPPYLIPADNPFVGNALVADEIWGIGLRNPYRISFDGPDLWIADVGQNAIEEVDLIPDAAMNGGLNFGWRCYEGTLLNTAVPQTNCLPEASYTPPVFEYGHNNATGGFSITGGHVYRGSQYPDLVGYYICADYISSNFWLLQEQPDGSVTSNLQQPLSGINISTFGRDEAGEVYAADLSSGTVYQVQSAAVLPVTLVNWEGNYNSNSGDVELTWVTSSEENSSRFDIQHSTDGFSFTSIGEVAAAGNSSTTISYSFDHTTPSAGLNYYRLKQIDQDETFEHSKVITIGVSVNEKLVLFPNPVSQGTLTVQLPKNWTTGSSVSAQIFVADGKLVQRWNNLEVRSQNDIQLEIREVPIGNYVLRLFDQKGNSSSVQFQVN